MSALTRVTAGLRTIVQNPVERRAYVGRLKWLMRGSASLHAWSLEYRAGLRGRFAVDAERLLPDALTTTECPEDCGANAPLGHLYQRRHVYRLHGSVTSTASGATLLTSTQEPAFFVRESISWPFESILSHGLDIPEARDATPGPDGPTVVFPTNANYYHWLIEELPLAIRAKQAVPEVRAIAYGPGLTERHRIAAQVLGLPIEAAPLVVALRDQVLPGRADDSWFAHPTDARMLYELGERIAEQVDSAAAERIYVSRRNSARSLPQEAELERLLADQGFSIIMLETMPWSQQIATFRHAKVIAGLHGAGLSNLVFTPAGARLIELTNGYHYNRCFEFLAHVAGHHYAAVDSDSSPERSQARVLASDILTAL